MKYSNLTDKTMIKSPMSYDTFCEEFAFINNFKELGHGLYARVFGNKTHKYAYKVVLVKSRSRDAYQDYVKTIKDEKNHYFPRIRTITHFTYKNNSQVQKFYVVELEKLHKISVKTASEKTRRLQRVMNRNVYSTAPLDDVIKMGFKQKKLKEAFKIFEQLTQTHERDWHRANMMVRTNGQLVFTDPVC